MAPEKEKFIPQKEPSEKKGIFESAEEEDKSRAKSIEVLKEMKELVEGTEVFGLREAKEILGEENVLGLEDVEKYMLDRVKLEEFPDTHQKEEMEKIRKIPYSKEELEEAKELGEFLVLRSGFVKCPTTSFKLFHGTTIEQLKIKFPDFFSEQKEWFKDKMFFKTDVIKWEWKLVRKKPFAKSANYAKQENWIATFKERKNLEKHERRRPVEIVYDTILYWLKNGKPPFKHASDWSSEELPNKKIVRVGMEKGKIFIGSHHPDKPKHDLGVCPQR